MYMHASCSFERRRGPVVCQVDDQPGEFAPTIFTPVTPLMDVGLNTSASVDGLNLLVRIDPMIGDHPQT